MLHTFHRRNFTDAGLCHILRGLQFELHLDVAGRRPATEGEQAMGRYLASVANRTATHTLRTALEYCEANTIEALQDDPSFMLGLTEMEREAEERLEREAYAFYDAFRSTASGRHRRTARRVPTHVHARPRAGVGRLALAARRRRRQAGTSRSNSSCAVSPPYSIGSWAIAR